MTANRITVCGEEVVDWRPEWHGPDQERYSELRREVETRSRYLRDLRLHLGLTQREVADLLGVTQSNVSKIESRPDATIGDLRRVVESRGGRLRVVIETPGAPELELLA